MYQAMYRGPTTPFVTNVGVHLAGSFFLADAGSNNCHRSSIADRKRTHLLEEVEREGKDVVGRILILKED